jgi:hypothetical protein
MITVPDAPIGWPMAIAPPLGLVFFGSRPSTLATDSDWAAKASLDSTTPMSSSLRPALASAMRVEGIGPSPMTSLGTPPMP